MFVSLKMRQLSFCMISLYGIIAFGDIQIKPIEAFQIQETKNMVIQSILENLPMTMEAIEELDKNNEFEDILNPQLMYFESGGVLYVALDGDKVIGSGAIKRLDDETCELKRMWFFKPYIGKGYGLRMVNKLFEFAKNHGYKKVCLDVYFPETQHRAVTFYKKLGFYEIKPYKYSVAQLYMEKCL